MSTTSENAVETVVPMSLDDQPGFATLSYEYTVEEHEWATHKDPQVRALVSPYTRVLHLIHLLVTFERNARADGYVVGWRGS